MTRMLSTTAAVLIAIFGYSATAFGDEPARAEKKHETPPTTNGDNDMAPGGPTGEAPANGGELPARELRIDLTFYSWLSSMSSTVETNRDSSTSEVPLSKILDALDFANFVHLEVQRGKWGLFSELDFVKLSNDTEFRNPRNSVPFKIHADGVIKQTMAELGVMHSFDGKHMGFDLLAGARYFGVDSDVSIGPLDSKVSNDWIDPMVGARVRWRISENWLASLRADWAGFGAGSELSTNIIAAINYKINDCYSVGIGYRYLDIDYEGDKIDMSMTTYGPVIGMTIHF